MRFQRHKKIRGVLVTALTLLALSTSAFAHGGEDHGESAPIVQAGAGMQIRSAHTGDIEVAIKHTLIEPDKETTARVFVTRFETNEPIEGARIFVRFGDATVQEVAATASNTAGIYEVKLPPVPKGRYALTARVEVGDAKETVQFGQVDVKTSPPGEVESGNTWARMVLIILAALVALAATGMIYYRLSQNSRRNQTKKEAVIA